MKSDYFPKQSQPAGLRKNGVASGFFIISKNFKLQKFKLPRAYIEEPTDYSYFSNAFFLKIAVLWNVTSYGLVDRY
jgi:hypothetical protein